MSFGNIELRLAKVLYNSRGKESVSLVRAAELIGVTPCVARRAAERLERRELVVLHRYGRLSLSSQGEEYIKQALDALKSAERLLALVGREDDELVHSLMSALPAEVLTELERRLTRQTPLPASPKQNSPTLLQLSPK